MLEHAGARHLHRGERQEGLNALTGWYLGFNRFTASPSLDLTNLRNEGRGSIRYKSRNPSKTIRLCQGGVRVQWGMSTEGREQLGQTAQVSNAGRA